MPPVLAKPADCSPNAPVIIDLIVSESEEESPQPPRLKRYKACTHRASFPASPRLGISPKEYRQLRRWNIPKDYLQLLCYHHVEFGWISQSIEVSEWMSGIGRIWREGESQGYSSRGFEIETDSILQDFLGVLGCLESITVVKGTRPLGLQHWDTVCSSWVWVCADASKRSIWKPMGDTNREFVRLGNCMVSRMVLYVATMRVKRICFLLEQPGTTCMDGHIRFQEPCMEDILFVRTWMGCFGGETAKPSKLFCFAKDFSALSPLKRKMTRTLQAELKSTGPNTVHEFVQDGVLKCTGHKAVLKNTQKYPKEYANEVLSSWEAWRKKQTPPEHDASSDSDYEDGRRRCASWPEANLRPVIRMMRQKHGNLPGHF